MNQPFHRMDGCLLEGPEGRSRAILGRLRRLAALTYIARKARSGGTKPILGDGHGRRRPKQEDIRSHSLSPTCCDVLIRKVPASAKGQGIIVRRLLIDIDGVDLGSLAPTHAGSLTPGHEGVAEGTLSGGSFFYVQDCPCSVDIDERNLDPGSFFEHREIAAQFEIGR
jgi:hypothetical protein